MIIESKDIVRMTRDFVAWIEREGYDSYDPYDLWGTKFGVFARRLYYRKNVFGLPSIAPILLLEIFFPSVRRLIVKKERFATADAQLLMGYLNLFEELKDEEYLKSACSLADDLLKISISGYQGHCWGYPFDWQTSDGIFYKNTPFITATPYCYEAFLKLYEVTADARYRKVAESGAKFVAEDLKETKTSEDAAAGSYSPADNSRVINASAYRAMVLLDAANRFNNEGYEKKGMRNLEFVLETQQPDGSWYYEILDGGKKSFIDNFHTCFNLKNLFKISTLLDSYRLKCTIQKGYEYYRRELFDEKGLPKCYTIEPRMQIVRLEMYNFAEAISFGALSMESIPEAFEHALTLAMCLRDNYQTRSGHFITREYKGGLRHKTPFLRWPQAQLFYALTNLLVAVGRMNRGIDERTLASANPGG